MSVEDERTYDKAIVGLRGVQSDFFDLIQSHSLFSRIQIIDRESCLINKSGCENPDTEREILEFFESINSFWRSNYTTIQSLIKKLPGRYVNIDQGQLLPALRKYGLFFDGLLVTDQLQLSATDTLEDTHYRSLSGPLHMSLSAVARYIANIDLFLPKKGVPKAFLVPSMKCTDSNYKDHWTNSSLSIATNFFSELCDNQFDSLYSCGEYSLSSNISESRLNPDLLKRIFHFRGASNLEHHAQLFREAMRKEQGRVYGDEFTPLYFTLLDASGRIHEYEKFSSEAYFWGQTNSIPIPNDIELYKWWATSSSRHSSKALGLPYDEDSLFLFAGESQNLGFLQNVPIQDFIEAANLSSAQRFRSELKLSDSMIRSMRTHAQSNDFDAIANSIIDAIKKIDSEQDKEIQRANREFMINASGTTWAIGLLILSQAFPPLSFLSLLGGGSIIGTVLAAKKRKRILDKIKSRPITALCNWHAK